MPGYWGELWGKDAGRSGTLGSHAWGTLPIDEFGRYGNFIARSFAGSYWAAETYTGYGRYVATAGVPITSTGSQSFIWVASGILSGDFSEIFTRLSQSTSTGSALWLGIRAATRSGAQHVAKLYTAAGTALTVVSVGTLTTIGTSSIAHAYRVDVTHTGSGTYTVDCYSITGGSSVGSVTLMGGADYIPGSLTPALGYMASAAGVRQYEHTWETITDPPPDTILRFIGTWANGSGTYEWGGDVLGYPGNVQDRAYGPDDTAGWASTVGVTIDNSAGQWGSFAGTGQLPFEGLWNLRQYWSGIGTGTAIGSWVDLFTGYLEPDGVSFDYGRSQVRLTLQSTIARAAQTVARMNGTISAPCEQELVGTVTYADADTGTVRIGNHDGHYWEIENGCALWGTTGTLTPSVKIGSSITPAGEFTYGGTGTIVVDGDFPPWLTVGAPVWATLPWPSYVDRRNPSVMVSTLVNSLGLTWPIDNSLVYHKQQSFSSIAPNDRLYGGEKLTTALSGIMKAVNGFYSVDPTGQFRAFCLIPRFSVAGTVDFNAAFDSDWQMTYEPAYSQVEVDCSYNVEAGSFTEHVSVGGTQAWGEVKKYELKWLGSGIEAQSMAGRLYRNAYLPRPSLTLRLAGSSWADYQPGNVYAINNLPAQLGAVLAGTNMICYSRTYSWADDLTAMEFVALPGGNYAVWDGTPADYWEGSGKVWY